MKSILLLLTLSTMLSQSPLLAQRSQRNTPYPKTGGKFEMANANGETTISYFISKVTADHVLLELQSVRPFEFNAAIINAEGKVVMQLRREEIEGNYASSIDVSKLGKGTFYIEVFGGSKQAYRIPFVR
ncbi:MAG TPA: hypothetical protein VL093_07850 [Flavipsychrobacter sp.]|nr:hypothetical protein [Flavipsychrobacter sp.]